MKRFMRLRNVDVVLRLVAWLGLAVFGPTGRADDAKPAEKNLGFKVPDGFEVSLYAGDELAHDIFSMTIDAKGRVVVSGPGYVKILHDDGTGKADRAILFSDKPKSGAQGMYFDGPDLICSGDGAIWRLRDTKGEDKADTAEVLISKLATSEHGAHAIIKGPDGWFYCVCGNDAGVSKQHITTDTSPVKEPKAGAILRFSPDGKQSEVFAHGFRNPYCIDFNATGNLFTVDSDNERDHYLPWYAPCRLFDVAQGMEHGWLQKGYEQSWNRPASFFDNVERMCEIGRGSPTGLVCYRHYAFPEHYRGGLFSTCWTLGKIYYFPLTRKGSTFETKLETFLETTGSSGFAPTALAVGPSGEMYISIGGRGTRGSVYRIRYTKAEPYVEPADPLTRVLRAPQPLSSWSRAKWEPEAKKIGAKRFENVVADRSRSIDDYMRAVQILTDCCDGVPEDLAKLVRTNKDAELTRQVDWSNARKHGPPKPTELGKEIDNFMEHPDPKELLKMWRERGSGSLSLFPSSILSSLMRLPYQRSSEPELFEVGYVRAIQLSVGDLLTSGASKEVLNGYQGKAIDRVPLEVRKELANVLDENFPSKDAALNRETGRTLGMLGIDQKRLLDRLLSQINTKTVPQDDIHYLIVLSLIPGERTEEVTKQTAEALANLHRKMIARAWLPSRNWPLRVGELFEALVERDPKLRQALGNAKAFGLPEHSLFVLKLKGAERENLARNLLAAVKSELSNSKSPPDWTPQFIECLKSLPRTEYIADLRARWDEPALRDAIAAILAEQPEAADRERFVQALASVQAKVVERAAGALAKLPPEHSPGEIAAALRALRQVCQAPQDTAARQAIANLLDYWSGEKIVIDEKEANNQNKSPHPGPLPEGEGVPKNLLAAYQPWYDWFAKTHPDEAAKLRASTTYDEKAWLARLAKIDFDRGDAVQGKAVFDRRNCSKCHQGSGKLGPELVGAAARFSREDLFTAILDPSKDVAPQYRQKIVTTTAGETYTGLIVYESPEGVLLQTGPDTQIRVSNVPEGSIRTSAVSLMPTGLINDATDQELADLYAYLRTLKK